jgi:hypothetical protein
MNDAGEWVLVIDSSDDVGKKNSKALAVDGLSVYFDDGHATKMPPEWKYLADELPSQDRLLFVLCHQSSIARWDELRAESTAPQPLVVRYTTGGTPSETASQTEYGILGRALTADNPLKSTEATQLVAWAHGKALGQQAPVPQVLEAAPRQPEYLPALAILCQGYLAVAAAAGHIPHDHKALDAMGWKDAKEEIKKLLGTHAEASWQDVQTSGWWLDGLGLGASDESTKQLEAKAEAEATVLKSELGELEDLFEQLTPKNTTVPVEAVTAAYCHLVTVLGGEPCK